VATSVAIGVVSVGAPAYAWIPLAMGMAGAGLLLDACVQLIRESRVALKATEVETEFMLRVRGD
jgi:hypothetical protein